MAKASVIIPAYNAEKVLPDCLKALKSQSTRPLEVIIVDDGSKDSTSDVAKKFGAKVLRPKNKGPASARNLGASKASGDILLFTDADCVPDKDWVKEMMAPFRDKEAAGVQGAYRTKQKQLLAKFSQAEIEDRYRRMGKKGAIDF
ncbi:MAG: glycosyltransferase family A protein, partial [Candidatus Aenigmarchaeota archaeon]